MLWNRSLVMYDVETRSHWSHILGEAMQGELLDRLGKATQGNLQTRIIK